MNFPWSKKSQQHIPTPQPEQSDQNITSYSHEFFGGVIRVNEENGRIRSHLTDAGSEKLKTMGMRDLLVYSSAVLDTHKVEVLINLRGSHNGPLSCSYEFLAFKVLMSGILARVNELTSKSDKTPEIEPHSRYDIAKEEQKE